MTRTAGRERLAYAARTDFVPEPLRNLYRLRQGIFPAPSRNESAPHLRASRRSGLTAAMILHMMLEAATRSQRRLIVPRNLSDFRQIERLIIAATEPRESPVRIDGDQRGGQPMNKTRNSLLALASASMLCAGIALRAGEAASLRADVHLMAGIRQW